MADLYPKQLVGVIDGTKVPPGKADGREIGAHKRSMLLSKVPGTTWNIGDVVRLGKKPKGQKITSITVTTDTSLGTSTLSVGIAGDTSKYVAAKTATTTDVPNALGPKASTLDDDPGAEEEMLMTIGVAAIASATLLTVKIELCGV
ncbi:hypothetical protein [Novosphingobium sp. BL-52-GroH]|uniref:hypothetical protein n=1 Tax=Novosphingobium sp. BL-52-GroH TaxID=3349877 RepID=UPI00384DE739